MKLLGKEALLREAEYLRLLIYGEPGTGKTWMGASACLDEDTAPVLYLEYRAQIASLRSNPDYLEAIEDGRLVILSLEEYKELNHVYTYLFRGPGTSPQFDNLFPTFPKTVITDSTTELQRSEVIKIAGNPDKFLTEVERPLIQHWGSLLNQFTLLANKFYALPMHVGFIGLEAVDYGPRVVGQAPQVTGYRLALQGQAVRQFPAYALTVMRLERAPRNSKAFCVGYTQAVRSKTKEQTGRIPAQLYNPNIPALARMLREGGEAE